jgi:RNA polymerase sigma factor (sigma-70 family)
VRNTILGLIKINSIDLDDCVANVYAVAWKKRAILEKHPDIEGWLAKAAQLEVKRFLKEKSIELMYITELTVDMEFQDPMCIEDIIEDKDFVERFLAFINDNFNYKERELFRLKCIEQKSNDEIAEILEVKRKNVDVRITRLREKIRNLRNN